MIFGKLNIILGVTCVLLASALVLQHKLSQDRIQTLVANAAKLEQAVLEQQITIETMNKQHAVQTAALQDLAKANSSLNAEKDALVNKLIKHDLEELSRQKPGLIQQRINNGTQRVFDDFMSISR